MNENPLVSIIAPVYKVEKYFRAFLDSVLAQTFRDFECILVDDGSPDGCGAICDEYAARDERIQVIHQPNGGACNARNHGIEVSRGRYLLILDPDDVASPLMIQWALRRQQQYPEDLIVWDFVTDQAQLAGESELDRPYEEWTYNAAQLPAYYVTKKSGNLYNRLFHGQVVREYGVRFDESLRNSNDFPFCQAYHEAHFQKYPDSLIRQTDLPLYFWNTATEGSLSKLPGKVHEMRWDPQRDKGYAARVLEEYRALYASVGGFAALRSEDANSICFQYLRRFAFAVWAARQLGEELPPHFVRGPEVAAMLVQLKNARFYHAYYLPFRLGSKALIRAVYQSDETGSKRLYWKVYWLGYYLLGGKWGR